MSKTIDIKHQLGDLVYLKTDKEQLLRVVTAITYRQTGIIYCLSCGTSESWNYDMEITVNENVLLRIEKS